MTRVLLAVAATVVLCAVGCNGISRGNLCCASVPGCASPGCSSCSAGGCASCSAGGCSSCAANGVGHNRTGRCCHAYSGSQYAKRANQAGGMGNGGLMNGGMGHGGLMNGGMGHGGMYAGGGHGGMMGPGGITACQQCGGRLGIIGNTISCKRCGIGYGRAHHLAGRIGSHLHPYAGAPTSTPPFAGNSGPSSAQVAYPYYTTRGPRDFFMNNPPTIGR